MASPSYGEPIRLVTACGHKRQVRWWVSDPLATALSVPQVTRCNRASCQLPAGRAGRRRGGRMTASNWTVCPRCLAKYDEETAAKRQRLDAAYGHVTVDEFDRLRAELTQREAERPSVDTERGLTFREDYETYTEDGELHVSYGGSCESCGLTHRFRRVERFFPPPEATS